MAVNIVNNGIVSELSDPKIVRNGVVEDINYIYSCKGGADSLVWEREQDNNYYLQSTGTQYITLNYKPNAKTIVKCKCQTTSGTPFSSLNTWNSGFAIAFNYNNNTGAFTIVGSGYISPNKSAFGYSVGEVCTFTYGDNNFTLNNISRAIPTTVTCTNKLKLFVYNSNITNVAIYSLDIYEDSSLIHSLRPKRIDGTLGFYDKVDGSFYTNAGTGTFLTNLPE